MAPVNPAPRRAVPGWAFPAAVALLVLWTYWPALSGAFLDWDDNHLLLLNPHFRGLGREAWRWAWTNNPGLYMPLVWMSFSLDSALWGMNPVGFHLTNVLFHAANAVLLFFVAETLFERLFPRSSGGARRGAAALASLLWAVHPLRVESVAWIVERKDVLCGFFFLLSLLFYLRFAATGRPGERWLSAGAHLAGMLSKPVAVLGPLVFLLLDWRPLARWPGRPWKVLLREKIPFFLASGAAALLTIAPGGRPSDVGPAERLGQALFGLGFYLQKTLWPTGLAPVYEWRGEILRWSGPPVFFMAIGAGFLLLWLFSRRRWPSLWIAGASYLLLLAPLLGLIPRGPQSAADRFTYLPGLGLALLAAALPLFLSVRNRRAGAVAAFLLAAALGPLTAATRRQIGLWKNSETLWRWQLERFPSSFLGHYNLGTYLLNQDRPSEALPHLDAAVRLHPDVPDPFNNRGRAFFALDRLEEAGRDFDQALLLDPAMAEARLNRGQTFMNRRRFPEAALDFAEATRRHPEWTAAWIKLGLARRLAGDLPGAAEAFRRALVLDPGLDSVRRWLAELPAS